MTQYPGYASPQQPYMPPANPRPTSVTVIAIIGIIAGALGLLCNAIGMVGFMMLGKIAEMGTGPNGQPDPALQETVKQLESIMPLLVALAVVKMLIAIVAIVGGIGALKLAPWGRMALLGYAVALIVATLAEMVISMTMVPQPQNQQPGQAAGSMAGGICGALFWIAYPICVLVFMNKPDVKAAFRGETLPGAGGPGGPYPPQGGYVPPPPPPSQQGPYAQ